MSGSVSISSFGGRFNPTPLDLFRLSCLIALVPSLALFLHYVDPASFTICGNGSGCELVRRSGLGYLATRALPLPASANLPAVALIGYSGLLLGSVLSGHPPILRLLRLGAVAGGIAGIGLFLTQLWVVGALCTLCVLVDAAAVAVAFAGVSLTAGARTSRLGAAGWLALGTCLLSGPVIYPRVAPLDPLPAEVAALAHVGRVSVVAFSDPQCPFCRKLHPELQRLRAERGSAVQFVQKYIALPAHEHSERAVRAILCSPSERKRETLVELLMTEPLEPDSVTRAIARAGLDSAEVELCISSPATQAALSDAAALYERIGGPGLPLTYIGPYRLLGYHSYETLKDTLDRAAYGGPALSVQPPVFLLIWSASALIVWFAMTAIGGRATPKRNSETRA